MSGNVPAGINPDIPNVARMYDYYLGGRDNFASDRAAAEKIIELGRQMGNDAREIARANRAFLGRAVGSLAATGIRQFLDIGAGLPTQDNVHQVAKRHATDSRVAYVDNDPVVLNHARALLARDSDVITVEGDLRDADAIFDNPDITSHLDFSRPIAVLLVAILHFVPDNDEAAGIVGQVKKRLRPGDYLVLSHVSAGTTTQRDAQEGQRVYSATTSGGIAHRGYAEIFPYFDGLELLPPGLVPVADWKPAVPPGPDTDFDRPGILGAVARVPG
ncbi:SAM-dependent methyltransferase [Nonomuraea jiangxiensis]|uniref:S-adenosyl methyltransferase n=1 Tax=Nonomuraea jiangxiensis TaxID=633440 RepID=A0A1G8A0X1_9ACTN|nr:SAM-dependent methyltransferase [Nonomuraea jiangxiensis]SDH14579.1 S-adenosyl methyltransferase [Nonomuraea jiangxiensis]